MKNFPYNFHILSNIICLQTLTLSNPNSTCMMFFFSVEHKIKSLADCLGLFHTISLLKKKQINDHIIQCCNWMIDLTHQRAVCDQVHGIHSTILFKFTVLFSTDSVAAYLSLCHFMYFLSFMFFSQYITFSFFKPSATISIIEYRYEYRLSLFLLASLICKMLCISAVINYCWHVLNESQRTQINCFPF